MQQYYPNPMPGQYFQNQPLLQYPCTNQQTSGNYPGYCAPATGYIQNGYIPAHAPSANATSLPAFNFMGNTNDQNVYTGMPPLFLANNQMIPGNIAAPNTDLSPHGHLVPANPQIPMQYQTPSTTFQSGMVQSSNFSGLPALSEKSLEHQPAPGIAATQSSSGQAIILSPLLFPDNAESGQCTWSKKWKDDNGREWVINNSVKFCKETREKKGQNS